MSATSTPAPSAGQGARTASGRPSGRLEARGLHLAYDGPEIVHGIDLTPPDGAITVLAGPNGCGKSTLLRAMSRLLTPREGVVLLDGEDLRSRSTRAVARELGLLPQGPDAPPGLSVRELVSRGRYPHRGLFRGWSEEDEEAVAQALADTRTTGLADRDVDSLSGGQRQRVWIAMVLAQRTGVLLLDEPTTFLDLTHQVEVLDLLRELNERRGTTIVVVLHELALAARYADHLVLLRDGRVLRAGAPAEVLDEAALAEVFDLEARVVPDPVTGSPLVVPVRPLRARERDAATQGSSASLGGAADPAAAVGNAGPARDDGGRA